MNCSTYIYKCTSIHELIQLTNSTSIWIECKLYEDFCLTAGYDFRKMPRICTIFHCNNCFKIITYLTYLRLITLYNKLVKSEAIIAITLWYDKYSRPESITKIACMGKFVESSVRNFDAISQKSLTAKFNDRGRALVCHKILCSTYLQLCAELCRALWQWHMSIMRWALLSTLTMAYCNYALSSAEHSDNGLCQLCAELCRALWQWLMRILGNLGMLRRRWCLGDVVGWCCLNILWAASQDVPCSTCPCHV